MSGRSGGWLGNWLGTLVSVLVHAALAMGVGGRCLGDVVCAVGCEEGLVVAVEMIGERGKQSVAGLSFADIARVQPPPPAGGDSEARECIQPGARREQSSAKQREPSQQRAVVTKRTDASSRLRCVSIDRHRAVHEGAAGVLARW